MAPQMRNSYEFRLVQVPSYFGRAVSFLKTHRALMEKWRAMAVQFNREVAFSRLKRRDIQRNKTIHLFRNDFLMDSECPRICVNVGWWVSVSKQFVIGLYVFEMNVRLRLTNHGLFRDGDPPPHIHTNSGTLRIHEKIISIKMGCLVTLYSIRSYLV